MQRDIAFIQQKTFDVLVIGGGINGAAIANIAAKRGLKVALLEKGDFASGTSSKSTKLLHGGIRYLENLEFDLVYESLHERFIQLQSVPHLAKPIRFLIPVYHGDRRPLWLMKWGVFLYDAMAGRYRIGRHQSLGPEELLKLEPNLLSTGLKGAVSYYDVQMDDARICLENVLSADQNGAHVANYVKVVSFLKRHGKITGVKAIDVLTDQYFDIYARHIVLSVGPWTNALLRIAQPQTKKIVRTTKGIHIVYKGQLSQNALLIATQNDNRIFFIIPWQGNSLIGTTDTNYVGNPDQVKVNQQDIDYLFQQAKRILPAVTLQIENIVTSFAGLRPLIRRGGVPSKVSRRHLIVESDSGLIVVIGGKFTTYRKIAEECVNRIIHRVGKYKTFLTAENSFPPQPKRYDDRREEFSCPAHRRGEPLEFVNDPAAGGRIAYPLYGSGTINDNLTEIARYYELNLETIAALVNTYGRRFKDVLMLTANRPRLKEPICTCTPFIKAQILYAIQTEMAQTSEDIIHRRLSLCYRECPTRTCEKVIEDFLVNRE